MKAKSIAIALFLGILFLSQLVLVNPVTAQTTKISAAGDNSFVLNQMVPFGLGEQTIRVS